MGGREGGYLLPLPRGCLPDGCKVRPGWHEHLLARRLTWNSCPKFLCTPSGLSTCTEYRVRRVRDGPPSQGRRRLFSMCLSLHARTCARMHTAISDAQNFGTLAYCPGPMYTHGDRRCKTPRYSASAIPVKPSHGATCTVATCDAAHNPFSPRLTARQPSYHLPSRTVPTTRGASVRTHGRLSLGAARLRRQCGPASGCRLRLGQPGRLRDHGDVCVWNSADLGAYSVSVLLLLRLYMTEHLFALPLEEGPQPEGIWRWTLAPAPGWRGRPRDGFNWPLQRSRRIEARLALLQPDYTLCGRPNDGGHWNGVPALPLKVTAGTCRLGEAAAPPAQS